MMEDELAGGLRNLLDLGILKFGWRFVKAAEAITIGAFACGSICDDHLEKQDALRFGPAQPPRHAQCIPFRRSSYINLKA
jgi:hypothetical protein